MKTSAKQIALGGIMAALAVTVMSLGGMIPVATYVCPMVCALLLAFVLRQCGKRIAWAWYGGVTILSLLMGPDKEAGAVFLFLGYYPIVKPFFDKSRLKWLLKALLFNGSVLVMYWLLIHLFGMGQITREFQELGTFMLAVMLVMGNVIFFLLDRVLDRFGKRK
jgi:hypothetical protein